MAGNFSASAGVQPAQSRTSMQGGFTRAAAPAPQVRQVPAGYQLAYQMGGPQYMYGVTPRFGAYYSDGGTVPGQIYGNMRGSREGADMFGFWPTMFQSSPYATASQMYTPGLGVMPLIGYPSRYPHVIMGGYTDYGAGIANQSMNMMLPLLMMGLYRQMFPMAPQAPAPAQAAKAASGGGGGGGKSGGSGGSGSSPSAAPATLKSSGASAGDPATDYSAVDGMPVGPSPDGIYHVHDTNWKPGSAAAAATPSPASDAALNRALRTGMLVPGLQPFAAAASFLRETPKVVQLAKDNPVAANYPTATRAVASTVPVAGAAYNLGTGIAPRLGDYFMGR